MTQTFHSQKLECHFKANFLLTQYFDKDEKAWAGTNKNEFDGAKILILNEQIAN